jgi:hypothetical protein
MCCGELFDAAELDDSKWCKFCAECYDGSVFGATAQNKEDLLNYVDEMLEQYKGGIQEAAYLMFSLPCGCSKTYKNRVDVPDTSEKCSHGNYFIRYLGEQK